MKWFGWALLLLELLDYFTPGRANWLLPPAIVDFAVIISATALIIAGNFKNKMEINK